MSERIAFPRYAVRSAQMKLARAEAVVDAFCGIYDAATRLFTRRIPAATENEALKIRRAWLRASA
ncbi:MAG TPA: hypothetical protein VFX81_04665 [Burkholderiaceae bacterium]|nr:hypothetical protein [Burkholderiaceae bacterium]